MTRVSRIAIFAAAAVLAIPCASAGTPANAPELQRTVVNFRLLDHEGRSHELRRHGDAKAIVIYSAKADCDVAAGDVKALNALAERFASDGARFAMLDGSGLSRAEGQAAASAWQSSLPLLLDETQLVPEALGIVQSGEAIVIKTDGWEMVYRGAVEPEGGEPGVAAALEAVLAGSDWTPVVTAAAGAPFAFPSRETTIDYAKDVAPIIQAKCLECHTQGGIGPFSLQSYQRLANWAPMIREVVLAKRMPPWFADPHHGDFVGDIALDYDERRTLVTWIEAGAPRGEGDDPLAQTPGKGSSEWVLGEPDVIVPMEREEYLSAQGVFDYRYQEVLIPIDEDKWVKGVDVVAGNKQVLHHALIFVRYPPHLAHLQPEWNGGIDGYFAGYVPGKLPMFYPEGTGQFLPKGSSLIFQLHYTATGKPEKDLSSVGLYFYDEKPAYELVTRGASQRDLAIPPGERDVETRAVLRLSEDVMFWGMNPHMHLRGSRFKYTARFPDGNEQVLLSVPYYDFNWQSEYQLREGIHLPAGTRIICEGAFDNSPTNPANPDPERFVRWGDQSFQEMFIGFMTYAPLGERSETATVAISGPITPESLVGTEWRFMNFKLFFDKDGLLLVNDAINGTWSWSGETIAVEVAGRNIDIQVDGNQLSVQGRPIQPWS